MVVSENMLEKFSGNRFLNLGLLWLMITGAGPFLFYSFPWHPHKYLISVVFVLMALQVFFKGQVRVGNTVVLYILFLQVAFSVFGYLYHGYSAYLTMLVQFVAIALVYLYISTMINKDDIAYTVVVFNCLMGVLGIIAFFLYAAGWLEPFSIIYTSNGGVVYNFILTFSNAIHWLDGVSFVRIAGFFDEPGTFAYVTIFSLLINKVYLNDRRFEIILVFTGLFTTSVLFYVVFLVYLVVFYFNRAHYKYFVIFMVVVLILSAYIFLNPFDSEFISGFSKLTIGRFLSVSGAVQPVNQDVRVGLMADAFEAFLKKPVLGYGISFQTDPANEYFGNQLGSNPFGPLAREGVIGVAFYFMHYFYLLYTAIKNRKDKPDLFKAVIVLSVMMINRQDVFGLFFYLLVILLSEAGFMNKGSAYALNRDGIKALFGDLKPAWGRLAGR